MKKYKLILFLFLLSIILNVFNIEVYADDDKSLTTYMGEVLEIIDGEIIKVKISDSKLGNPICDVKLIGVKTNASEEAYKFVYESILNQPILLKFENSISKDSSLQYGYIYYGDELNFLNKEILQKGIGEFDNKDLQALLYKDLNEAYTFAKDNYIGLFEDEENDFLYQSKININLSSQSEMVQNLINTDATLASKIINYRTFNEFNSIDELKFIDNEIDSSWIDSNKRMISIITNINMAQEIELLSLFNNYYEEKYVNNILDYRTVSIFNKINDLKNVKDIKDNTINSIRDYIDIKFSNKLIEKDLKKVNINTAAYWQLMSVLNISEQKAKNIVKYKNNDKINDINEYSYKNKEDIIKIDSFTNDSFNHYEDNISLITNVNTASETELDSLFGEFINTKTKRDKLVKEIISLRPIKYKNYLLKEVPELNSISNYINVEEIERQPLVNINLASEKVLKDNLNCTTKNIKLLKKYDRKYYNYSSLPIDLSSLDNKITLFTNINNASKEELKLLHYEINDKIANKLIETRNKQRFSSRLDLEKFFEDMNKENIFKDIKIFIVYR